MLSSSSRPGQIYLIFGLVMFVVTLLIRLDVVFSLNPDISGIEQNVIYTIQTFLSRGELYPDTYHIPFAITQYAPLYYYLCAGTARVFSIDPARDIHMLYIIGRTWSLIFGLLTSLITYFIARNIFKCSYRSCFFLFLVSGVFVFFHGFAARPDAMHDALVMGAFYFSFKYSLSDKTTAAVVKWLVPVVLLSAAAVFTKQSGIQMMLLFGGFCLLIRDWRTVIIITLLCALIYGGLFLLFSHKFPFFTRNILGGVANGVGLRNFFVYVWGKKVFLLSGLPMGLVAGYMILKKRGLLTGPVEDRLLSADVLGTFLFATLTALKMGSATQYYAVYLNLVIIFFIHAVQVPVDLAAAPSDKKPAINPFFVYSYFLICMVGFAGSNVKFNIFLNHSEKTLQQRLSAEKLAKLLAQKMGNRAGVYFFADLPTDPTVFPARQGINNLLFKEAVFPQLDIMYYSSGPMKIVDYASFENDMKTGKIAYIVEPEPRPDFSISAQYDSVRNAYYHTIGKQDGYLVYEYSK